MVNLAKKEPIEEDPMAFTSKRRRRLVFDGVEIPLSGYFDHKMDPKAEDTETKITKAEMKAQIDAIKNVRVILKICTLDLFNFDLLAQSQERHAPRIQH